MTVKITHFYKETSVEGNAIEQLNNTAKLGGMKEVVAMPDLHAGKGHPIGAAFLTENIIYPYLVGNDIGCGMSLYQIDLFTHKMKRDKLVKNIGSLEESFEGSLLEYESKYNLKLDRFVNSLGTIGQGNHFCEIQSVEKIVNQELFDKYKVDKDKLLLMIHTGSRGLGESILSDHISKFNSQGLVNGSSEYNHYIKEHNYAIDWAKINREVLAKKVSENLGSDVTFILDIVHNGITVEKNGFLHRKGVAPSDQGLIVIPGSRGDYSFLIEPILNSDNLNSLAHGAGRKWKRSESKARLSEKYKVNDLLITELKSAVICEDKDLLYEEAPQNYKKISKVISDLESFGLIKVVAILKPILTYKKKDTKDCC